ncbi:hypothetical protein GCM10011512_00790 [Tersicoccus solisilvae]|uniref:Excalibur calcium-binding domain-containing protein n=1 Tax=Tersicoccus solisilvae TaxID=1882339 RepID=A0ABQ1NIM3_9MICC|nr:excalibur calcium-binding domain-containing protein [Tersicoccus solisilvae]GGC78095.1 hypothetical protein GCM10011512_00790 [Tersicoccus solisilvae]
MHVPSGLGRARRGVGSATVALSPSSGPPRPRPVRIRPFGVVVTLLLAGAVAGCADGASPGLAPLDTTSTSASSAARSSSAPAGHGTATLGGTATPVTPRPSTAPVVPPPATPAPSAAPTTAKPAAGSARALLATLPVKGRAPKTGYRRDRFGPAWSDTDRNGCDTRNDILAAQLTGVAYANAGRCRVSSGTLADPYTGATVGFVRGQGTSELVQIDHVVALSDAWQKGGQQLTDARRLEFANDPLNLQATTRAANTQKGDGDAATWLPAARGYRCAYVARQITVKSVYRLWITAAERDAVARVLAACPDQPTAARATAAPSAPAPAPATAPPPAPADPGSVYYPNCSAARAAGVAPLHRGEPGYRSAMDGDDDGIACE